MIFQNLTFIERDIQKKQDDIQHTIHSYMFPNKTHTMRVSLWKRQNREITLQYQNYHIIVWRTEFWDLYQRTAFDHFQLLFRLFLQRFVVFSCIEICNEPFSYADPMADNYYFKMRFHIVDDQSAKWSTSSRHLGNKTIRFNKVFHLCIF